MHIVAAKDAPILAAAIAARPRRLVTLDTHDFDRPEVYQNVPFPVLTPGELLIEIRAALVQALG